MYLYDLKLTKL
jgi:hypothetical protein